MDRRQGQTWTFTQLGGEKKKLILSAWGAPFGRPRQEAVVNDGIHARTELTYYPGTGESEVPPTRHVFGSKLPPWELTGRFRDRAGGLGFAMTKHGECKSFAADKQLCEIHWGDIRSVIGFIDEYEGGIEAQSEVKWKMKVSIDKDLLLDSPPAEVRYRSPADYTQLIVNDLADVAKALRNPEFNGDIFDALDTALSAVQSAAGLVKGAADGLKTFVQAPINALNKMSAALSQLKGACVEIRETIMSFPAESSVAIQRAKDHLDHFGTQTTVEEGMANAMNTIEETRRAIVVAKLGRAKSSYVGRSGDTWESISTLQYGTPKRASDIRAANGVPTGQAPVSGQTYLLPA